LRVNESSLGENWEREKGRDGPSVRESEPSLLKKNEMGDPLNRKRKKNGGALTGSRKRDFH